MAEREVVTEEPTASRHVMYLARKYERDSGAKIALDVLERMTDILLLEQNPYSSAKSAHLYEAFNELRPWLDRIGARGDSIIRVMRRTLRLRPERWPDGSVDLTVHFSRNSLIGGLRRDLETAGEFFYDLAVEAARTLESPLVLFPADQVVVIGGQYHAREEVYGVVLAALDLAAEALAQMEGQHNMMLSRVKCNRADLAKGIPTTTEPAKLTIVGFPSEEETEEIEFFD